MKKPWPYGYLVGPTACGKTEFAVFASKAIPLQVLNCDSVQVYREVDVGTAKPSARELEQVPHHLLSFVAKGESFSIGDYVAAAQACYQELTRVSVEPQLALFVGGSGFYVQALQKGMFAIPELPASIKQGLEKELASDGLSSLYQELLQKDPVAAGRIASQDRYRIIRALEVIRGTGKKWSDIQTDFSHETRLGPFSAPCVKIGLFRERESLRGIVAARVNRMLDAGWVDEVERLRKAGLGQWAPLQSVGYRQVQGYLDGQFSRGEMTELIVTATMQLAKRQMTWFRRDPEIQWFDAGKGMQPPLDCLKSALDQGSQS